MTTSEQKILFAARRWTKTDGTSQITLVIPKTGQRFDVDEAVLRNDENCQLGDFLSCHDDKVEKISYLTATVNGDVAYIDIRSKLVNIQGSLLFQSVFFDDALCRQALPIGDYEVRINLLITSQVLSSGTIVHFEATNPKPIRGHVPSPVPVRPFGVPVPTAEIPWVPPTPSPTGGPKIGSTASTPSGNPPIIKGVGFANKYVPKKNPKPNKNVVGTGFQVKKDENQEKKVIVGAGFAVEKKEEKVVVGAGFEQKAPKTFKLRAVVLSIDENENTKTNTHYLWVLDRQAEGRFVTKDYKLLKGHCFEGIFKEGRSNKWNCEKYEKGIKPLAEGGIDEDDKIWFTVRIDRFQPPGGNRRFGQATAKFFGEILEGELESTKLSTAHNGKQVKIQRKGIAERDYVWMVIEIL